MKHLAHSWRFHLSHALSSSFRVHNVARYLLQLIGKWVIFFLTDQSGGFDLASGATPPSSLVEGVSEMGPANLSWDMVLLDPGNAL